MKLISSCRNLALGAGFILFGSAAKAQESVNSAGGQATGSGGTASYSIGQVFYSGQSGSTGSLAEGVQHPFEIFVVGNEKTVEGLILSVYPNPAAETLVLQASRVEDRNRTWQLRDVQGRLLREEEITAVQTRLDMKGLPVASYFLHVLGPKNQTIQIFKILKK
jgi:hypothetical protein